MFRGKTMNSNKLFTIIKQRQKDMPENSYISSLFKKGKDRIIQKVGEETIEVVIAAKNEKKDEIISEVADLWFHLLILLARYNIAPSDIEKQLQKRHKSVAKQVYEK